jgi:hypothetical protein
MSSSAQTPGRIVVGVDSSPSSRAALVWAVRQARLTGASVEAVIAWHAPAMSGAAPFGPGGLENWDYGEWAAGALTRVIEQTVDPDGPVRIAAISSYIAAGLMLVLSILGFVHLRHTAPEAEILPRLATRVEVNET